MVRHLPAMRGTWVWSLGQEDPWRRKWQATPVLLPGKSHGWRSLVGYSTWGRKESDTTERLHFSFSFSLCLSLLFSAICKETTQTTILPFCIPFSWGWFWSLPSIQCYEPVSIVVQALCLSDLIPWIYLSLPPLYNHKEFYLGHTWMA